MKKFFLGFYKFEKCEPGEYEYQIDLMPENVEQQDYYDFMEEAGVEVVCRWIIGYTFAEKHLQTMNSNYTLIKNR